LGPSVASNSAPGALALALCEQPQPDGPGGLARSLADADIKEELSEDRAVLAMLTTLKPRWDKKRGTYSLDFIDRKVRGASSKNIQMVAWDHFAGDTVLLQLAKIGKDRFALDFGFLFCAETAFAVVLAAIDKEVGVKITMTTNHFVATR
jgi:hypothetical protein